MRRPSRGFTMIELLTVLVIVGILLSIAIPAYSSQARRARRTEAIALLQSWALAQERWRADNPTYTTNTLQVPIPTHPFFNFTVAADATTYTLTATATGDQLQDKAAGATCSPLTLNRAAVKSPAACFK